MEFVFNMWNSIVHVSTSLSRAPIIKLLSSLSLSLSLSVSVRLCPHIKQDSRFVYFTGNSIDALSLQDAAPASLHAKTKLRFCLAKVNIGWF